MSSKDQIHQQLSLALNKGQCLQWQKKIFFGTAKKILFAYSISVITLMISAIPTLAASLSPEAEKEPEQYNIMPLITNKKEATYDNLVYSMFVDQGYEAYCASKPFTIAGGIWGDLLGCSETGGCLPTLLESSNPYIMDLRRAHIPMLRGFEANSITKKNDSFEGMFGANIVDLAGKYNDIAEKSLPNTSGVAERLLDFYEECLYKKRNMDVAAYYYRGLMTNLDDLWINETIYFKLNGQQRSIGMLGLRGTFRSIRPEYAWDLDKLNPAVCADLAYGGNEKASQEDIELARAAIQAAPLDMRNLYRFGFLVIVPRQNPDGDDDDFKFIRQGEDAPNAAVDNPLIVAFKIPEFGTNKSYNMNNIDSAQIVKKLIQSKEQNEADDKIELKKRQEMQNYVGGQINSNPTYSNDGLPIMCAGQKQCIRKGKTIQSNEYLLFQVIADAVNGAAAAGKLDCNNTTLKKDVKTRFELFDSDDYNREVAGDIFTPANKDLTEFKFNLIDNNLLNNGIKSYNLDGSTSWKTLSQFDWSLWVKDLNPKMPPVSVKMYVVLPIGSTLENINKSLTAFWDDDTFDNILEESTVVDMGNKKGEFAKFFDVNGHGENISFSGSAGKPYCYKNQKVYVDGELRCIDEREFGVSLADNRSQFLIPDKGLGWLVREIQKTVRNTFSESYNYVKSCKRIEDLFLGRCGGSSGTTPPTPGNGESCSDMDMALADVGLEVNKDAFLSALRKAFPATKMNEEAFDYLVNKARGMGWNPALFLALGWEETGWGAVGNIKAMGCLGGSDLPADASISTIIDHQLDCIGRNFTTDMSCTQFMCKYSGDSIVNGECTFNTNPIFGKNLPIIYGQVTKL